MKLEEGVVFVFFDTDVFVVEGRFVEAGIVIDRGANIFAPFINVNEVATTKAMISIGQIQILMFQLKNRKIIIFT
jgi:hypothetical protein